MKNTLIRLAILAPVIILVAVIINRETATKQKTQVLGSSIIITVGESGVVCTSKALLNNEQTGELTEIDGVSLKGAPLGSTVTYQTTCQNSGSTTLNNITLSNNLSGQNQIYVTYKATSATDCVYQNGVFSCTLASLASGGTFTKSFTVTVSSEVPDTTVVTNLTEITAAGVSGSTTNNFTIYMRPVCTSLNPAQNPIIVVEGTPLTLVASGTTYDGSGPTYIIDFGDGSNVARQTTSNFAHTYSRVTGETESTYFAYLRISDSLGNATGDAANCSADCSKIVKVVGTLAPKYCACVSGVPSCSAASGSINCTDSSSCSASCSFYCDQASQVVTPSTGKSPLSVSLNVTAGGSPTLPLTVKVYDGSTLLKQETASSKSATVTINLTNSTQTTQTHTLTTMMVDAAGQTATNNCLAAVAVQPGTSAGHYECQNLKCVYSPAAGQNTCTSDTSCQIAPPPPPSPPPSPLPPIGHLECNATTKVCEAVESSGSGTCTSNTECQTKTGPAHFVCNKVRKTCESYYGAGPNSCAKSADCVGLKNGYTLPTIIVTLLGSSLLLSGLVAIIKLRKN